MTITTVLGSLGLSIGSAVGGKIGARFGLRRSLLVATALGILSNFVKLIDTTATVMVGRLLFGFFNGITSFCQSKAINDTVPPELMNFHGSSLGFGLALGIFLSNFLAVTLPIDESGTPEGNKMMAEDQMWRLVYGFPILLQLISFLAVLLYYTQPSIIDLLEKWEVAISEERPEAEQE